MASIIISKENVRPSFPTPQTLRTYKLSMLDQLMPPHLGPFIIYFPNTTPITNLDLFISQTTSKLKQSLSLILTRFYPLAGRVNTDGQSIDCNDEGIPFSVVKIGGHKLSDLVRNPNQNSLHFLLPSELKSDVDYVHVALIQVNYFNCGGMAIGAALEHKVVDAESLSTFINSWAGATRDPSKKPVCPNYIFQSFFPHVEVLPKPNPSLQRILKTGELVIRRYVFHAAAVSSLRFKSTCGATRVEAVAALIWKCFMAASLANNNSASAVIHSVNMRRRARPTFPSDCFGNFVRLAVASSGNGEGERNLGLLVMKQREAIRKIDDEFVNRMRGDDGLSGELENNKLIWGGVPKGADYLFIMSWCGFGLYDIDFGWGKPELMSRCDVGSGPKSQVVNTAWLTESRNGGDGGIEAWVALDEKYMSVFENDKDLWAFASVDQF